MQEQVKDIALTFTSLKAELEIVELEERLEMVSLASLVSAAPGGNGCCCANAT